MTDQAEVKNHTHTIMVMAGGTGGHVFPGIALAHSLEQENVKTVWLGTDGGLEQRWVTKENIEFESISIKGLRGNGALGWLMSPINITRAWLQARALMKKHKPTIVLGMGGFVSGPGGMAAISLGIPLVVHEQNAVPGLTNKILAKFAKTVITAFPQNVVKGKHVIEIGNPVRAGFRHIPCVNTKRPPFHLLVVGGSRGALALNEIVPKALALFSPEERPTVVHQTGDATLSTAKENYMCSSVNADIVPFVDDMVKAYEEADLLICRSGALTISELMAAARPAIMVPYPHAVDDHQTANAQALVALGGGEIISQKDLTPEWLYKRLVIWLDKKHLKEASESIRAQSPQNVEQDIVNILLSHMEHIKK